MFATGKAAEYIAATEKIDEAFGRTPDELDENEMLNLAGISSLFVRDWRFRIFFSLLVTVYAKLSVTDPDKLDAWATEVVILTAKKGLE